MALLAPLRGQLRVTSPYGPRPPGPFHTGTDFAAVTGTMVLAAADGTARRAWNGGGGWGVIIDHGGGVSTEYWHLSGRVIGSAPVAVRAGQLIAYSGASGTVTGPHLHFEVKINGGHTDPMRALGGGLGNPTPIDSDRGRVCWRQVADPGGGGFNNPAVKIETIPAPSSGVCPAGYNGPVYDPGESFLPGGSGPELIGAAAGKVLGLELDEALLIATNVGVVVLAVALGYGGVKRVIGG